MIKKKLFLVPLMLLAAMGSLQAASAPGYMVSNNGWRVADSGNCGDLQFNEGKILAWGAKGDSKFSTLSFSPSMFYIPDVGSDSLVNLGTLSYFNANSPNMKGPNKGFTALWNMTLDDVQPVEIGVENCFRWNSSKDSSSADTLYVDNISPRRILFTVDKKKYALTLLGFFDREEQIGQIHCDENKSVDYILKARVSSVPIPATAWLFGSGLLGLLGFRRRQTV